MTLGTGIFLSSILLGLIYLYVKTKSEWNWRKILMWFGAIFILFLIAILIAIFWEKITAITSDINKSKNHTGLIKSYENIAIGESISEIEFKYGKLKELGKTSTQVPYYLIEEKPFLVVYKNINSNKVDFIGIDCEHHPSNDSFNGIGCGTSSDDFLKKYPDKVKVWCPKKQESDEVPYRVYDLAEFGTRFYLIKNKVVGIRLYRPEDMKDVVSYMECN